METNEKLRASILHTIKRLTSEGKNIFAGYYQACNGNVILTATRNFKGTHVNYCCFNMMWDFTFDFTEFPQGQNIPLIIDHLNLL